jgi:hypothetical protein
MDSSSTAALGSSLRQLGQPVIQERYYEDQASDGDCGSTGGGRSRGALLGHLLCPPLSASHQSPGRDRISQQSVRRSVDTYLGPLPANCRTPFGTGREAENGSVANLPMLVWSRVLSQIGGSVTFALFAFWAVAYMNDPPLKSVEPEAPPIEVGVLAGRDGVAFGPGIILQGNLGRLGLYGFAGTSSITGYQFSPDPSTG